MSSIFRYIRDYYKRTFHPVYFFLVVGMIGFLIYLNYYHSLEDSYVNGGGTKFTDLLGYFLLFFVPFALAFFLQGVFYKECSFFRNKWFWVILVSAPAFYSFRINFDYQEDIYKRIWSDDELDYWRRCLNWIIRVFIVLIPVYILWWCKDRKAQPFYGTAKLDNIRPYLLMLAIMIPLIAAASTQHDFQQMYPRGKFLTRLNLDHKNLHYAFYELCYGFDFISIEFFFRGFLILSLSKICGEKCIVPAACFYCTIHFGKPMGEAISSFWGGMLLGIVSYNTRSVWGGLIVHLGIAWLMELGGWIMLNQ